MYWTYGSIMYLRVSTNIFTSFILDYCRKEGDIDELISVRFHFTAQSFLVMESPALNVNIVRPGTKGCTERLDRHFVTVQAGAAVAHSTCDTTRIRTSSLHPWGI
jgi:hypothetical protein